MASSRAVPVKVMLIGDSGVGKTCLMLRRCEDTFKTVVPSSKGMDYRARSMTLDGRTVKLEIWDAPGHESFRNTLLSHCRWMCGFLLIFSVCDRASFDNVAQWKDLIDQAAKETKKVILIGHKVDTEDRAVSKDQGSALAGDLGIKYFECSAKDDIQVSEAFEYLAKECLKNRVMEEKDEPIRLETPPKKEPCCIDASIP